MIWLFILLVMLLVISPVMWLKPSPRQKRVATLRNAAMQRGLKVALRVPPLHGDTVPMPAYRWHYPPQQPGPDFMLVRDSHAADALKPFGHGWRWRKEPLRGLPEALEARLKRLVERLPQDALVVESDTAALTLWWHESQGFERFSTYLEDFQALRDGLAGRPDHPQMSGPPAPPLV
ncbi:MAG: preprotein translocase subunit YajC [Halomonas sp.]|uniref:preprotein translocase subunit YajC n=1 Tax=Halomonas sp. TaxID=1486246 RepID=UPI0017A44C79|nr:preprotein translocase subunit YajC [Halomonas sp.]NWN82474.1 preprotein translocase subunit YajC [Halomonas sp.]